MSVYSDLAHEIFSVEFDSNTDVASYTQISGWFSTNLGMLNNLIYSNFTAKAKSPRITLIPNDDPI